MHSNTTKTKSRMPGITASVPSFCTQQCSWSAHPSVQQGGRNLELPGRWRISGTVNHDHINKAALQRPLSSASVQKDPFLQSNVNFHPHRAIGMNSAAKGYFFCLNFLLKAQSTTTSSTFLPRTRVDNHLVLFISQQAQQEMPRAKTNHRNFISGQKKKSTGDF